MEIKVISPWVRLVTRTVVQQDETTAVYHSIQQADYVNVLATLADGRVAMVRQYRPAVDRVTLELPGGLREADEDPVCTARRELLEEAGLHLSRDVSLIGCFDPDYGRLENKLWAYYAAGCVEAPGWVAESGVERIFLGRDAVKADVLAGRYDHAPHLAVMALAILRGIL